MSISPSLHSELRFKYVRVKDRENVGAYVGPTVIRHCQYDQDNDGKYDPTKPVGEVPKTKAEPFGGSQCLTVPPTDAQDWVIVKNGKKRSGKGR